MSINHDTSQLGSLRSQITVGAYIHDIWDRRDFLMVVPRQDARARQTTTVLGQFWHLLNPALMIAVYYLIFGVMLKADRGIEHYVSFLTVGIMLYQMIQRIVVDSASTIQRHLGLIRTVQFPRALLPLSTTIEHVVTFVPSMALLVVVAIADGAGVRPQMLLFPLIVLVSAITFGGAAFVTARIGSFVPDLREVLPHLFRLLMYASGVVFSIDSMVGRAWLRSILKANPIYLVLALGRWSILGMPISWLTVVGAAGWMVFLPTVGFVFFRGGEQTYGA